ncbi:hypothetical protein XENOCAPTIV_027274 [Xenoophorus captivus]|uniref:C2H2-type domain-containing protein n=1 Tax=Xenoophorus captivus TaxID=1517983 RepID=A0ABV0SDI7_9TELE
MFLLLSSKFLQRVVVDADGSSAVEVSSTADLKTPHTEDTLLLYGSLMKRMFILLQLHCSGEYSSSHSVTDGHMHQPPNIPARIKGEDGEKWGCLCCMKLFQRSKTALQHLLHAHLHVNTNTPRV